MPSGFRGDAAKVYLTAVDNALIAARNVHKQLVFISPGVGQHVPLPRLSQRIFQNTPHLPAAAHSGGNAIGYGNSQNIVVDENNYFSIEKEIYRADRQMAESLYRIGQGIIELCGTSFVLPQTSRESIIFAMGVIESMNEFQGLTESKLLQLRRFVSAILSIRG
jgi:hypothetical protein